MPGYWDENATMPKMTPGYHRVKVVKVIRETKKKGELTSKGGDPQLMVVFANANDAEAVRFYTLAGKAKGFLARDMSRLGVDLTQLEAQGVKIEDFEKSGIANSILLNKSGWCRASEVNGYIELEFLKIEEVPESIRRQAGGDSNGKADDPPSPEDESIPFDVASAGDSAEAAALFTPGPTTKPRKL